MYLLVITNKSSNILEDLDTLRLLAKLVPDYVHPVDDEGVAAAAFDLLFAFDEAVTLGHREAVTPAQVRAACEMESHEERLHKMVIESKVADTRDLMKRKAAEIERARLEQRAAGVGGQGGQSMMMPPTPQMGGGGGSGNYGGAGGGFGGGGGGFAAAPDVQGFGQPSTAAPSSRGGGGASGAGRGPKKGLRLGAAAAAASTPSDGGAPARALGGGGGNRLAASLRAEGEEIAAGDEMAGAAASAAAAASSHHHAHEESSSFPAPASGEPLTVALEERVSASLSRDGGLEAPLEVQGTLSLAVHDEAAARVVLSVDASTSGGDGSSSSSPLQWQFKTHPNIDKAAYASSGQLRLKDAGRPFPRGTPLGVLKWRAQSSDESALPVTINCWPSVSGAETFVNIEYECGPLASGFDLRDLTVSIPAAGPPASVPSLDGEWRYDARARALLWTVELVDDDNRSGSAEFVFPASTAPPASFFPVDVAFRVEGATLCPLKVVGVEAVDDGAPVKHGLRASLVADGYQVV